MNFQRDLPLALSIRCMAVIHRTLLELLLYAVPSEIIMLPLLIVGEIYNAYEKKVVL